jgi:hypothetical protein
MLNQELARFLCSRTHFSPTKRRVKYSAFLPSGNATSVFMVVGLTTDQVWELARTHVAKPSNRTVHGCAYVGLEHVRRCRLEVDPDNSPPRHANIVGWPENKAERKSRAIDLAAKATLGLPND